MSEIKITPLHDLFAARLEGIDVAQPIAEDSFAQIRYAFNRYGVLVFPDQRIDATQQQRFAELLADRDKASQIAEAGQDRTALARMVCDYIAGMTDRFAYKVYGELVG